MQPKYNFNGQDITGSTTTTSGTVTYPYPYPYEVKYDKIEYCPFCGKKLPVSNDVLTFCPFCGKQLPQTTTQGMFIFHWNYPDGTPSWPRDGIINPITICNTQ